MPSPLLPPLNFSPEPDKLVDLLDKLIGSDAVRSASFLDVLAARHGAAVQCMPIAWNIGATNGAFSMISAIRVVFSIWYIV